MVIIAEVELGEATCAMHAPVRGAARRRQQYVTDRPLGLPRFGPSARTLPSDDDDDDELSDTKNREGSDD